MNTICKADGIMIGLLANELDEWFELNEAVRKEGVMVKLPTATGFMQDVVNPKIKIRDNKIKVILKILSEFGMSPAARSGVQTSEHAKNKDSALYEFLSAIKK
ncbi:hypothetical protein C408_4114 [Vibrio diabolicus E0666]|nr:hypothetical protein C408_4114 [Vibrio diabolicus E0666]